MTTPSDCNAISIRSTTYKDAAAPGGYTKCGLLSGPEGAVNLLVAALVWGGFLVRYPDTCDQDSHTTYIPIAVADMLLAVWGHTHSERVWSNWGGEEVDIRLGVDAEVVSRDVCKHPKGVLAATFSLGGVAALHSLLPPAGNDA